MDEQLSLCLRRLAFCMFRTRVFRTCVTVIICNFTTSMYELVHNFSVVRSTYVLRTVQMSLRSKQYVVWYITNVNDDFRNSAQQFLLKKEAVNVGAVIEL